MNNRVIQTLIQPNWNKKKPLQNGNVSTAGEFNHQSSYKYTCNPKNQEFVHLMANNKYYLETKDDRAYIYAMNQVDVFRHNKRYTHPYGCFKLLQQLF